MKKTNIVIRAIHIHNATTLPTGTLFESLDFLEETMKAYMNECRAYRQGSRLILAWDHPTLPKIRGITSSEFVIGMDPCSCPDTTNPAFAMRICERIAAIRLDNMIRRLNLLHFELNR